MLAPGFLSDGFKTNVFPQMQWPRETSTSGIIAGKLKGVILATTPMLVSWNKCPCQQRLPPMSLHQQGRDVAHCSMTSKYTHNSQIIITQSSMHLPFGISFGFTQFKPDHINKFILNILMIVIDDYHMFLD